MAIGREPEKEARGAHHQIGQVGVLSGEQELGNGPLVVLLSELIFSESPSQVVAGILGDVLSR